jgi:hypothetical protein
MPRSKNEKVTVVEFVGAIPGSARAIDFHGDGGARLQLDIPDTEKAAALAIPAFFLGKRLRVRIEALD